MGNAEHGSAGVESSNLERQFDLENMKVSVTNAASFSYTLEAVCVTEYIVKTGESCLRFFWHPGSVNEDSFSLKHESNSRPAGQVVRLDHL